MSPKTSQVTGKVKLLTTSTLLSERKPVQGNKHEWTVKFVESPEPSSECKEFEDDANIPFIPLTSISRVEYFLHPTSELPHQVYEEMPFKVTERGGSEFELKIVIHFRDVNIPKKALVHGLHFRDSEYEKVYLLKFSRVSGLLRQTLKQDPVNSADVGTELMTEMGPHKKRRIFRGEQNKMSSSVDKGNTESHHSSSSCSTGSKTKAGPMRAPPNLRVTCRFDYQPDICKDYKETGFCGYGDSCIFLHDRGDYKTGWQLEKEWNESQGKLNNDPNKYLIDPGKELANQGRLDEELPFACLICRKRFERPVVTRCKHYFCEKCALLNYKKSSLCFACGAATNGVFNTARDLQRKLKNLEDQKETEERNDDVVAT